MFLLGVGELKWLLSHRINKPERKKLAVGDELTTIPWRTSSWHPRPSAAPSLKLRPDVAVCNEPISVLIRKIVSIRAGSQDM